MTMNPNGRRNSCPQITQATPDDGNCDGLCIDFFIKIKQSMKDSSLVSVLPFLLSIATLVLALTDLATDIASANRICTAQCKCEYGPSRNCTAADDICKDGVINGTSANNYCLRVEKETCKSEEVYPVPEGIRHPILCRIAYNLIIGPHLLTNLILLITLLCKDNYKKCLNAAGLSYLANTHKSIVMLTLSLMAMFLILPYLCLLLKIKTTWNPNHPGGKDENYEKTLADKKYVKTLTMTVNGILSYTEDLPQLMLQMIVLLRAALRYDDGIVDMLSWVAWAGVVTSCLTITLSKSYREYIRSVHHSYTSLKWRSSTAFISAGARTLSCCLMAVVSSDGRKPWKMLLPVSAAIAIQITFFLIEFCFSHYGISIVHNCLCPNKILDNSEYIELKSKQRNSSQCPNDSSYTESQNISNKKPKYQKLLDQAYVVVTRIQSLLFSITIDGQSHYGLAPSACYALFSLWIKLRILTKPQIYTQYFITASTTALIFAMLSFTINTILVLINNHHRKKSLVISVLFIIYPIYLYIMAKFRKYYMLNKTHVWYRLKYDGIMTDDILAIVNPVLSLISLVLLVNIISVVLGIVKARNRKKYFKQKIKEKVIYDNNNNSKYNTI